MTGKHDMGAPTLSTLTAQGGEAVDIDAMVNRFLCWKLPEDFYPDGGISFTQHYAFGDPSWPVGTNLLNAVQARAMIEHLLAAGAPTAQQPLDDSANNAGVATGSRNESPSESVTRGNLPPSTPPAQGGARRTCKDSLQVADERHAAAAWVAMGDENYLFGAGPFADAHPDDQAAALRIADAVLAASCHKCKGRGYTDEGDPEVGSALFACDVSTPPAPSSSAVAGLVGKWEQRAETAKNRGELATFHIAHAYARELKDALASTAASGGGECGAAPAMPDGWVSIKRDYCNEGRDPIPTVTFTFKPDDWQSRDRFARAFTIPAASAQGDGDGAG